MIINRNTKRGKALLAQTSNYQGFSLSDVYGSYSWAKGSAWQECFNKFQEDKKAYGFRITSHNSNFFTVAWDTEKIDADTGEIIPVRHVETAYNSYDIQ